MGSFQLVEVFDDLIVDIEIEVASRGGVGVKDQ
jgi:hypothetical protein